MLEIDNKKYDLEIEDKTGKIIKISLQNNDFSDDLEQLMINFVKYLDLYIIDDWTFEENMLKSKKAELVVKLNESDDDISLSINSSQKLYEYVMK